MRNTNKPPYAATDIDYNLKNPPTKKQIEVLIWRCWGLTQDKIAEKLGVSRSMVRLHIKALKKRGLYPF
jgi:predicted ArsR family transcriptional regulator